MKLVPALGLKPAGERTMISFAGGGGKTSSLFALAYELAGEGKNILITTTTAMYNPEEIRNPNITVLGDHVTAEGKLKGITQERANAIYREESYDFILVEVDGSRGRPIKAPAEHEPVIPEFTGIMIGVIGMDAFGKALASSYVHRPEILAELTGTAMVGAVNDQVIINLVLNPGGLFKNCPPDARKVLLLNKVFEEETKEAAIRIGYNILKKCNDIDRILIGAVQEREPVKKLIQR